MWNIMLRDGVISQAQYDHVQEHGSLPTNTMARLRRDHHRLQSARRASQCHIHNGVFIGQRKRRRPAGHSYEVVWPKIQAKVAENQHEQARKASARKARVAAYAAKHGVEKRTITSSGTVQTLYDVDKQGGAVVLSGDMLADAERVNADELWPGAGNGYTLSGSGITIGIWDDGEIRTTHDEMQPRATQVHTNDLTVTDHATAMAGVAAAGGVSTQYDLDGVVYAASVKGYDRQLLDQYWDDTVVEGIRVSNHSYSDECGWEYDESNQIWVWYGSEVTSTNEDWRFGWYGSDTVDFDNDVYAMKFSLPVWSVGNDRGEGPTSQPVDHIVAPYWNVTSTTVRAVDGGVDNGYDTIPSFKTGKNCLVIGAADVAYGSYFTVMDGSGWGPTDDGRLVPHVVAPGKSILAPASASDTDLDTINGSSPAAAIAAGVVAQQIQLDAQIYGTNDPAWASTHKAIIIHTAHHAGTAGPNYQRGYGLIDSYAAAELKRIDSLYSAPQHIFEVVMETNSVVDVIVYSDGTGPLKATIAWTEPGNFPGYGLDMTNSVLLNDVDLRISGPYTSASGGSGGTEYKPWVLDPDNPANAATTGDNTLDNVEQVLISSPSAGYYVITLTRKPPRGSSSTHSQDVSLVVDGNNPSELLPEFTDISAGTNGQMKVTWTSRAGVTESIYASTNLLSSNGWLKVSGDIDILTTLNEWVDTVNTNINESPIFYRVYR